MKPSLCLAGRIALLALAVTPRPGSADWRDVLTDDFAPVESRVAAALTGVAQDRCFADGGPVNACAWARFELHPDHVDPGLSGREAILIVDELPSAVEYLRYRNRILGAYTVNDEHAIAPMPVAFELPETFGDIVTGLASAVPIPSEHLAPLIPELTNLYEDHVPVVASHGTAVFGVLADLAPGQPLVLLDNNLLTFQQADPELFCSIPSHPERLDLLRDRARRFADDLRDLLAAHNVRFVNASFGYTTDTVTGPWQRVCGTALPSIAVQRDILEAYRPIFDALFATPGVFTAHAALASTDDRNAPFDQPEPEFPNRLRIGSLAHAGQAIPATGADFPGPGWNPVPPDPADADIYVNAGCSDLGVCRSLRPLSLSLQYGMGRAAFPLPQSSFVTPLALARLADLRRRPPFRERPFDNALIDDLIVTLQTGCGDAEPCRFFDPLLHGQMERFRNEAELPRSLAGLWYDPQRAGHGLELQRFGRHHAGLFYTFDEQGGPEWYWLDGVRYGGGLYGKLLRFGNTGTAEHPATESKVAGQFAINLESADIPADCPGSPGRRAAFSWSLGENSGMWCLQPLLVNGDQAAPNANGMWWNGDHDSGWGFGRYANEQSEFRIVYYYDALGLPTWAFGQDVNGAERFDMLVPSGYCRHCPARTLDTRVLGAFVGTLGLPQTGDTPPIGLQLDHWQRIGFQPERLSD